MSYDRYGGGSGGGGGGGDRYGSGGAGGGSTYGGSTYGGSAYGGASSYGAGGGSSYGGGGGGSSYGGGGGRGGGGGDRYGGGGGSGSGALGAGLRTIAWDLSTLPVFEKNFYIEHPDVVKRTEQWGEEWRRSKDITVIGRGIPKPVMSFEEASMPEYVLREVLKQGFSTRT